jgi:hypothetical protein
MPPASTYSQPNAGNVYDRLKVDLTGMPALIYPNQPNIDPNMPPLETRRQAETAIHNLRNPNELYAIPSGLAPPVVRTNKPTTTKGGKRNPTKRKRRAKKSVKQCRKKDRHTYRRKRRS